MRTPGREPEDEFDAEQAANLTDDAPAARPAAGRGQPGHRARPSS